MGDSTVATRKAPAQPEAEKPATAAKFRQTLLVHYYLLDPTLEKRDIHEISKLAAGPDEKLSEFLNGYTKDWDDRRLLLQVGERYPAFGLKVLDKMTNTHPKTTDEDAEVLIREAFAGAIRGMPEYQHSVLEHLLAYYLSQKTADGSVEGRRLSESERLELAKAIIDEFANKGVFARGDSIEQTALILALFFYVGLANGPDGKAVSIFDATADFLGGKPAEGLKVSIATPEEWDTISRGLFRRGKTRFASEGECVAARRDEVKALFTSSDAGSGVVLNPAYAGSLLQMLFVLPHEHAHAHLNTIHATGATIEARFANEGLANATELHVLRRVAEAAGNDEPLQHFQSSIRSVSALQGLGEYYYGAAIVEALLAAVPRDVFLKEVIPDLVLVAEGRAPLLDVLAKYVS